jgi:hypothetical protein
MSSDAVTQQILYEGFLEFFGFIGPEQYGDFLAEGLPPRFITDETRFLIEMLDGRSRSAAGLQIWQMGRDGVEEALTHAREARPDGVILHCYGWATMEEIAAAGDWIRSHGWPDGS